MRETALVIEVPVAEPHVAGWRLRHDPAAVAGVPAHVTILYPFRSPDALDGVAIDQVAHIATMSAPWTFELTEVAEFPGVLWLRPDPETPFRTLTSTLWEAFPDCPPYAGHHDDPQPHLTVAMVDAIDQLSLRDAIEADLSPSLPLRCTASALSLFESDDNGSWQMVRRFSLGRGTRGRKGGGGA